MANLRPGSIFISYRRNDTLDEARTIYRCFCDAFGKEAIDPFFDEKSIGLTEDWKKRLTSGLEKADILLALIGPGWINSFNREEDWVQFEIETALKERIDVIPVFLRQEKNLSRADLPANFPSEVAAILDRQGFFVKQGDVEPRASDIIASVRELINDTANLTSGRTVASLDPCASLPLPEHYRTDRLHQWDDENQRPKIEQPFLGPVYFSSDHAALFFGREKEVRRLYHLVRQNRLTLVNGYSGSGKSSLLRAGLLPRIETIEGWLAPEPIRRSKELGGLAQQLRQFSVDFKLPIDQRTLLIIDQVEEMYTDPLDGEVRDQEISQFGEQLQALLEHYPRLHIILAFRSEFQQRILHEFLPKYGLVKYQGELYLHPLKEQGIIRAIKGPEQYGNKFRLEVSEETARLIAKDFIGERPGPYTVLLQIQLVELWKAAKAQQTGQNVKLTEELYQKNRRHDLEAFIDDQLMVLTEQFSKGKDALKRGLGWDILYSYTTLQGTATGYGNDVFADRYSHLEDIDPLAILNALKRAYLLAPARQDPKVTRLAHDSLAPIIRARFALSETPGQQARRIIEAKQQAVRKEGLFSEADINIILAGRNGMQRIADDLWKIVLKDQARYRRQKQQRFELAFRGAKERIEHLDYAEALEQLKIASYEGLHPRFLQLLTVQLPFYFIQTEQWNLLNDTLGFLADRLSMQAVSQEILEWTRRKKKVPLIDYLKDRHLRWFQLMEARHFPEMIPIKGGTFEMGSNEGFRNEQPPHKIILSDFQMAATPVTYWQYGLFCRSEQKDLPRDSGFGRADRPVINVNWYEALEFCNWLSDWYDLDRVYTIVGEEVTANWSKNGYRLPTEAEWEFAARERGKNIRFGNGKEVANPGEMNFDAAHPYNQQRPDWYVPGKGRGATTPVKAFSPNKLDLFDMSGNVFEWCWDKWSEGDYYRESDGYTDPTGPKDTNETKRVVRGGSWYNNADVCRASYRNRDLPIYVDLNLGFRVVRR